MPGPRSGSVIRDVLRASPKTRVLILTMHDDEAYLRSALAAGAAGYLVKRAADSELLSAIRAVHAGRTFVDMTQTAASRRAPLRPRDDLRASSHRRSLSRREREVLGCWRRGTRINRSPTRSA